MLSEEMADRFIEALGVLEADRESDAIVSLFASSAEIDNVVAQGKFHGSAGAREFWQKYRDSFGEMQSKFRNRIVAEDRIALEWITEATTNSGVFIRYEGVSVLELEQDLIARFRAYFDAGGLGRQMEGKKQPVMEDPLVDTNEAG